MELIDIFYATDQEYEIACHEAVKLKDHIHKLSPGFAIDIAVFHGDGERKSDIYGEARMHGVYNPPRRPKSCSITITADNAWTSQGQCCYGFYRGFNEAHVRANALISHGHRSVDILVHEWLHCFAWRKWQINPDNQQMFNYSGKENDCEDNGWQFWYSALLGKTKPNM